MARLASLLLLLGCLLSGQIQGAAPTHVSVAFFQASFPDVGIQDVRGALAIWGEEVTRNVKGIDSLTTNIYPNLDTLVSAMRQNAVDLAILPTIDYFKVEHLMNAELGFVSQQGSGGSQRYFVIVQASQPANDLRGLKGLRFCRVKNDSMGFLYLNYSLLRAGLPESDRFFSGTEILSKESKALNDVFFGKADVCLVAEASYLTMVAMNPQVGRKLRILSTSPQLHAGLAVYRKGYPQEMRLRIQDAVGNLKNYPRGSQILSLFRATEIRPATEATLAETRRYYQEYRKMKGRLL